MRKDVRLAFVGCGGGLTISFGPVLPFVEGLRHRDLAVLCARKGIHVLLEKPMARSVSEGDQIIDAHRSAGTVLMVALMKRYNRSLLKAAELIERGEIGQVMGVRHCWEWAGPVRSVMGVFDITEPSWEVENEYNVICTHEGGARGVHLSTHLLHLENREEYLVFGETGTIELGYADGSMQQSKPYTLYLHRYGRARGHRGHQRRLPLRPGAAHDRPTARARAGLRGALPKPAAPPSSSLSRLSLSARRRRWWRWGGCRDQAFPHERHARIFSLTTAFIPALPDSRTSSTWR